MTDKREKMKQVLGELAGSASLCWNEKPYGIFDATQANKFVDDALSKLEALMVKMDEIEIEKVLQELMPKFIWGYVCKKCNGGGSGEGRSNCSSCNGVGITDWQTQGLAKSISTHFGKGE
jgi:hypothetical protein